MQTLKSTPVITVNGILCKNEGANSTGSVKDRALRQQLAHAMSENKQTAVISSSGNAALSAIYHAKLFGIHLHIFLPLTIHQAKLKLIRKLAPPFLITQSKTPNKDAFRFAKTNHAYLLRQSTDPVAWEGYKTLGYEIAHLHPLPDALFFPVGSGSTMYGTYLGLKAKGLRIPLFAVQPSAYAPIASVFTKYTAENINPTDALSVKLLPLKHTLVDIIRETAGGGYVVGVQDFYSTKKNFAALPDLGPESILAISGATRWRHSFPTKTPLVILTGKKRSV